MTAPAPPLFARVLALAAALAGLLGTPAPARALPELSATATWEATAVEAGLFRIAFTVDVSNDGDADAKTICLDLFWDLAGPPSPNDTSEAEGFVGVLPAKSSETLEMVLDYAPPGVHTATLFVDSCQLVTEGNELDNLTQIPIDIQPPKPPGPDIVFENLTVNVYDGVALFEARVHNVGDAPTGSFPIDVYLDPPGPPGVDDAGDQFVWVQGLDPDVTAVVGFPPVTLTPGAHTAYALADSLGFVDESDEGNNLFGPIDLDTGPTDPPKPDLFLHGLEVTTIGTALTFDLTVGNGGEGGAPQTRTIVVLDAETPPDPLTAAELEHRETTIPPLLSGTQEVGIAAWDDAPTGTHHAWVLLDVDGAATESSEENNVIGPITVYVQLPGPAPDLVVTSFEATVLGADVLYAVEATNGGTASTGPFDVDVFFDSEYKPNVQIGQAPPGAHVIEPVGLAPGESATYELQWAPADVGSWRSWVELDALNQIAESDEKNNADGPLQVEVVPVSGPDIAIDAFAAQVTGNDVVYVAAVTNTGDAPTGAFDVDVVYDLATAPPFGERGDDFRTVEQLLPGESATVSFPLDGAAGGSYTSWLVADTLRAVDETSEGNNIAGPREFSIDLDALQCAAGELLTAPCVCGGETVSTGYCCGEAWSALPCLPDVDAGGADAGLSFDAWLPGGTQEKEAGSTYSTIGGCGAGAGHSGPVAALLVLVLLALRSSTAADGPRRRSPR